MSNVSPTQNTERYPSLADSIQRLEHENQELRALLSERTYWLWHIHKEEEIALARALHDGPIQELSSLLFKINALPPKLESEQSSDPVLLKQDLKSAIRYLRQIVNDLHSPTLAHFGLQAAIRSTVEEYQTAYKNLHIALFIGVEQRPPDPDTECLLHSILQQLLQNTVEHAHAHNLMIRLRRDEDHIELSVEDDGIGFELPPHSSTLLEQGKTGLMMAKIQAEILNGILMVTSRPGEGTKIQVKVPSSHWEANASTL